MIRFTEFLDEQFNQIFDEINEMFGDKLTESKTPRQPWVEFNHNSDKKYSHEAFKQFYSKEIRPHIDKAEPEFDKVLKSAKAVHHAVKTLKSRKSLDSLHDKVVNRGRDASSVTDVLRGAILVKDKNQAAKVVDHLKKKHNVIDHDFKDMGKAGALGYNGVHHLIIKAGDSHHEIQIMPRKLFAANKEAHKIYAKNRSNPAGVPEQEKKQSRRLFQWGNRDR